VGHTDGGERVDWLALVQARRKLRWGAAAVLGVSCCCQRCEELLRERFCCVACRRVLAVPVFEEAVKRLAGLREPVLQLTPCGE
jgi:hypothetical protein